MSDLPWLSLLVVVPLLGAVLVALTPARGGLPKLVALAVSLLTLLVGVVAAVSGFAVGGEERFQLAERYEWIPQFGVSWSLGVDGISLALILMALVLAPVCLLAAWQDVPEGGRRERTYYALMVSLVPFMVGVFAATDVFLFYVFFEAMLIPVYFLIGMFGGPKRQAAAVKFLIYSLAGGLIMLVGVIALYFQGPGGTEGFLLERLTGIQIDPTTQKWLFVAFFVAFAVKAPMWPVHTWLPDVAAQARPAVSTLLVGVLDKVGTYGMIRFCLELFPEASRWATPAVLALAVVSVLYGAVLAIAQTDLMRLVAFTSISHFGFIVIGLFAATSASQTGANLYMINHGFSTAALFLVGGMLVARRGSQVIDDFGGWQRVTPALGGIFLVAGLSALSLPGLATFVSEFLVIAGTYPTYPVVTVLSALGVVLAALYVLLAYKRMMTGPPPVVAAADDELADDARTRDGHVDRPGDPLSEERRRELARSSGERAQERESESQRVRELVGSVAPATAVLSAMDVAEQEARTGEREPLPAARPDLDVGREPGRLAGPVPDITWREKAVVAPLLAAFLVLGVYPAPVLDTLRPAVERTLQILGVDDPAPTAPATSTPTSTDLTDGSDG